MVQRGWRLLDRLSDLTVALSYGSPGYAIRDHLWDDRQLEIDLHDEVVVITGANAGIGRATAQELATRGATVVMVCRNAERGERARREIAAISGNDEVVLELCDVSSLAQIASLVDRIKAKYVSIRALVLNAGVVVERRRESVDGIELSLATNVIGSVALLDGLIEALEAHPRGGRVIHVTSGGMYTQRIDVDDLQWERKRYDGITAYAQTKRAQVILNELWAEHLAARGIVSAAVHPGWAATPGVERALPRFNKVLSPILRTPQQGADTIIWLTIAQEALAHSGTLWFDREPRRTHVFPGTRESEADRQRLWAACRELAGLREEAP